MRKNNGSTQTERLGRASGFSGLEAIDGDPIVLLRRALEISSMIRYHNIHGEPDGTFRELLPELEKYASGCDPEPDGRMEPAQALLYTFIRNLHGIISDFNRRWDAFPHWYLDHAGSVRNLPEQPFSLWVSLTKTTDRYVNVPTGTEFILERTKDQSPMTLSTGEEIALENPTVTNVYSVLYDKDRNLYPASIYDCVTSVQIRDLTEDPGDERTLFSAAGHLSRVNSPGIIVSSPALLLREGRRSIELRLETESNALTAFIAKINTHSDGPLDRYTDLDSTRRILSGIFCLEVSTDSGWRQVKPVLVNAGDTHPDSLVLSCTLKEDFPATHKCISGLHGVGSAFPAVKIMLNPDAWLFPYSWIRNFILKRIHIDVRVEQLASLSVYNELGKIDNSKPFSPFGLHTTPGAWFVVGNYELAVKRASALDIHIRWEDLPADDSGLYGYYKGYDAGIDNRSFRLATDYLQDLRWHDEPGSTVRYLFASDPSTPDGTPLSKAPLTRESILKDIALGEMPAVECTEDEYDYSIRSKSGFVRFRLSQPAIGFGEDAYNRLFSERMLHKKYNKLSLNTPLSARIERITAGYRASDRIELRAGEPSGRSAIWHICPHEVRSVFPGRNNHRALPLIYSLPEDGHLVFSLSGVLGGEYLRLWFDFTDRNSKIGIRPEIKWYWGDGYQWNELPDDVIHVDSTENLCYSGLICLQFPDRIDPLCFDGAGNLWIRAGFVSGIQSLPRLKMIYTNAIELIHTGGGPTAALTGTRVVVPQQLHPVKPIPGLSGILPVSAVTGGRRAETADEKLVRVSEYVTHRGRAVTPRDYERLILQQFPDIARVQCFSGKQIHGALPGSVTVAVFPDRGVGRRKDRPKTGSYQLRCIERFLCARACGPAQRISVINPWYEEVIIRGRFTFRSGYSVGDCRARLKDLCDRLIAPWQQNGEIPCFGLPVSYNEIMDNIRSQPFVASIEKLTVIRISRQNGKGYAIDEYNGDDKTVYPSVPYGIFVPAGEHIFMHCTEEAFGVNEMSIGHHFIIGKDTGVQLTEPHTDPHEI